MANQVTIVRTQGIGNSIAVFDTSAAKGRTTKANGV
jgi:hypothetical protein